MWPPTAPTGATSDASPTRSSSPPTVSLPRSLVPLPPPIRAVPVRGRPWGSGLEGGVVQRLVSTSCWCLRWGGGCPRREEEGQRSRGIVKETFDVTRVSNWWSSCRRWCGWTGLVRWRGWLCFMRRGTVSCRSWSTKGGGAAAAALMQWWPSRRRRSCSLILCYLCSNRIRITMMIVPSKVSLWYDWPWNVELFLLNLHLINCS